MRLRSPFYSHSLSTNTPSAWRVDRKEYGVDVRGSLWVRKRVTKGFDDGGGYRLRELLRLWRPLLGFLMIC